MSIKSVSTLSDIPGLNGAVQHLLDLALRLDDNNSNIKATDRDNINEVVEAIGELAHECYRLHEKLETETIRSSVLRHKLKFFPKEIKQEIQRAVDAARQMNQAELNRLHGQSQEIDDDLIFLAQRLKDLDADNQLQAPEHDRIRLMHDEMMGKLNESMSEKASMHIHLNETLERIRNTNEEIVDLEEGILQLKEDLIHERADARNETNDLKKLADDMSLKLKDQEKSNSIKKIETDQLHDEMVQLKLKLDSLKGSTTESQMSCNELESREAFLSKKLQQLSTKDSELKTKNALLIMQFAENENNSKKRLTELQNKSDQLDQNAAVELQRSEDLKNEILNLKRELKGKIKIAEDDDRRVKEQNAVLEAKKQSLFAKVENVARLQKEISGMERETVDLNYGHRTSMVTLRNEVEDCRKNLMREKQERLELDDTFQKLEKEMDDFRKESKLTLNGNQQVVLDGKKEHDQLLHEGAKLQVLIKDGQAEAWRLEQQLADASHDLTQISNQKMNQISSIKNDIEELETQTIATQEKIKYEVPQFVKFEKEFFERKESFEETKKDLVASKTKMKNLEEAIKRTQIDIQETSKPQEGLQKELDESQKKSLILLTENMERLQDLEERIYVSDSQYIQLKTENARFSEGNSQLETELTEVDKQTLYNVELIKQLELELEKLKAHLLNTWMKESETLEEVSIQDHVTVDEFGGLLVQAEKRQSVVANVSVRLQSELSLLSEFLDNLSRRRPMPSAKREKSTGDLLATGETLEGPIIYR